MKGGREEGREEGSSSPSADREHEGEQRRAEESRGEQRRAEESRGEQRYQPASGTETSEDAHSDINNGSHCGAAPCVWCCLRMPRGSDFDKTFPRWAQWANL
ncbi:hypothetical protein EYF80_040241 [Liparis tanakae]|uniref:Uncharacterized protein n=1 Tax=Liparis tanakae TaxID=230148 RepID=A0A4Z2G7L7_9TELE|nr:hypothetical protein EYF80_040241 [Liparis tanakae]